MIVPSEAWHSTLDPNLKVVHLGLGTFFGSFVDNLLFLLFDVICPPVVVERQKDPR